MTKTTVLYHADADGFGAAFALWGVFGDNDATYIPVQYGQPVPDIPEETKALYIVDFSYKRGICEELAKKYELHVYDHHKTAEAELKDLPYATFDQSKSGCAIAWEAFHDAPLPDILRYVQDRDLWKFELPESEEVNLYIATLPWDFSVWTNMLGSGFRTASKTLGRAIKSFRDGQIKSVMKSARMMRLSDGEETWDVPVLNLSNNVSEVGNELCKAYPDAPFSVTYCDRKDVRSWSLRSIGDFDVSRIAKMFMGGGHKNAAGFSTDIGWPQFQPDEFIEAFEEAAKDNDEDLVGR